MVICCPSLWKILARYLVFFKPVLPTGDSRKCSFPVPAPEARVVCKGQLCLGGDPHPFIWLCYGLLQRTDPTDSESESFPWLLPTDSCYIYYNHANSICRHQSGWLISPIVSSLSLGSSAPETWLTWMSGWENWCPDREPVTLACRGNGSLGRELEVSDPEGMENQGKSQAPCSMCTDLHGSSRLAINLYSLSYQDSSLAH